MTRRRAEPWERGSAPTGFTRTGTLDRPTPTTSIIGVAERR